MRADLRGLLSLLFVASFVPVQGGGAGSPSERPALGEACRGDFGADDNARAFATFMQATEAFAQTAAEVEDRLQRGCRDLGNDLGMAVTELEAQGASTLGV